jgi:ubiquitin C-terminal hydrolase
VKVQKDPFSSLSITVPKHGSHHVKLIDCIQAFCSSETLDEKNKWRCQRCGEWVKAVKKLSIAQTAPVLVIHLKRFEGVGYASKKVGTEVEYPDTLEARSFLAGAHQNSPSYKLIGAVFHNGTMYGGHYTSAVLDQTENQWYYYNDANVSQVKPSRAHSRDAYILFYQRC